MLQSYFDRMKTINNVFYNNIIGREIHVSESLNEIIDLQNMLNNF